MFSHQTELHDLKAENRCLSRKCDQFKQLFYEALEPVDEVFQESRDNPNPILNDYVQLGENKFEAVKRLAKDYVDLKAENERLKAEVESKEQTLRYVDEWSRRMAPKIDRLVEEATAANAKIAELEELHEDVRQLVIDSFQRDNSDERYGWVHAHLLEPLLAQRKEGE